MKQDMYSVNIKEKDLWCVHDLIAEGFSRTMAYQLMNRSDVPTIRIGGRIFVHRELFQEWLKSQVTEHT